MNTNISTKAGTLVCGLIVAALFTIALTAAEVEGRVLANTGNHSPFGISDSAYHFLPINGTSTRVNIQIEPASAVVAVFFNAECSATGTTTAEDVSLDIDILIDGRVIPPSDSENRFCTVGYPGFPYSTSASTNVATVLSHGSYRVEVRARRIGASGTFAIDDSSTIAMSDVIAIGVNPNQFFISDSATHFLPITFPDNRITFRTTSVNQRVIIFFNAECSVKGWTGHTYLHMDVLIDGVPARPSNRDNVLCSDHLNGNLIIDEVPLNSNNMSVSTNVHALVPDPTVDHEVRVRVFLDRANEGDMAMLDDVSVIVMDGRNVLALDTSAARVAPLIVEGSRDRHPVPTNEGGNLALDFDTTDPIQMVAIFYNAECGVKGWFVEVRIDIFVDGESVLPSRFAAVENQGNILCSSTARGVADSFRPTSVSVNVGTFLNPGRHRLEIKAWYKLHPGVGLGPLQGFALDESSIFVF